MLVSPNIYWFLPESHVWLLLQQEILQVLSSNIGEETVQHLGHLQTGRMTEFAQPGVSLAWSYLFVFQVGAYPSFISGCAPVIYIFDLHQLVRPWSLCLSFQQECCNVPRACLSILSAFIALTLVSPSCPLFSFWQNHCRRSIPPPSRCSGSLFFLLLFFLSTCTPPISLSFLPVFFPFLSFFILCSFQGHQNDSVCFPRPQPWWLWVNNPNARGKL